MTAPKYQWTTDTFRVNPDNAYHAYVARRYNGSTHNDAVYAGRITDADGRAYAKWAHIPTTERS